MDRLYNLSSAAQRGTLYNIRDKFSHKNVKTKVSSCINHAVDLLKITTESMANLAMKVLHMDDRHSIPADCPSLSASVEERTEFIQTAEIIVDEMWPMIDQVKLQVACNGYEKQDKRKDDRSFCHCGEDQGGVWIECSARRHYSCRKWYHLDCLCLTEDDIDV
ncbi:uncharacterized protein LOC119724500 [Patiria miniata]|uniref:Zinc finger PHD-type domain-containing protein n=1 Tax=Patiria miniata TaxID=46514 RepID=A0A913ZK98_PATMI|nr:uncharacterized protein LOC119724500 [Patiria miniata]